MRSQLLLYPMLAMVLLTFATLVRLNIARVGAVRSGAVKLSFFRTYQGAEPEASAKLARHFVNLLEAPTLFYVACLAALATRQSGPWLIGLAWLYVAARVVHTVIHTGSNDVNHRLVAYFASWAVLLALWARVVVGGTPLY